MKRVNSGHDQGNKRLFSHPQAVEELLRGFLRADWVEKLDLSTLERVNNWPGTGWLRCFGSRPAKTPRAYSA
jgi:hypothetical protein